MYFLFKFIDYALGRYLSLKRLFPPLEMYWRAFGEVCPLVKTTTDLNLFYCGYKFFITGLLLFCRVILHVAPQVFGWFPVWAVSGPVKYFHLVCPKIFRNHFRSVTWCSITHSSFIHRHVYIQLFLKQLNILQAIHGGACGKKIQPSYTTFGYIAPQNICFGGLYWWCTSH